MNNFNYYNPTKIIFGKDTENTVGDEIKKYGKKVLLHYGGGSIKKSGLYDRVITSIKSANIEFVELGGVMPNPRLSLVREGIELCRRENVDIILAVGGGSVIDSSKAISIGIPYDKDVWNFFEGVETPKEHLPVASILTIPAAGSESSPSCVITNEEKQLKYGLTWEPFRPVFSILNPELCSTLPMYQVACGAADIMAHLCERYFTNTENVELSDRLLEGTMRTVINTSVKIISENGDYDTWANLVWSGTMAHNDILGVDREQDWASHGIEHEISAIYDIAHGAGLAIVFPSWLRYVYKTNISRVAQFAVRVFDVEPNLFSIEETALIGIERFKSFFKSLKLPTSLKEAGIADDRIGEMAAKCMRGGARKLGNFMSLTENDVKNILTNAR